MMSFQVIHTKETAELIRQLETAITSRTIELLGDPNDPQLESAQLESVLKDDWMAVLKKELERVLQIAVPISYAIVMDNEEEIT